MGIGGIGMSAIARYFNKQGHNVGGYDLTSTDLTKSLEEEGIDIHYSDNISLIPVKFMDPENTTVVYTPAIPNNMSEFVFFKEGKFNILKRSQVLGIITEGKHSICVAGSHGKTTTSTMIAHILYQSKIGTNAFLGGISKNYDTNLLVTPNNNLVVVEADEYDRSFLSLTPYMAVVTATDADHLDIYGSKEEMLKGFAEFTSLIQPEGVLIIKKGIELVPAVQDGVKVYTYSATDESADFHAENVRIANSTILFDFKGINGIITDIELGVPVMVNIENAVAAIAIALLNGASTDEIKNGVKSFDGTKRRFDLKVKKENVTYIDDYAHHPNEIKASIASVRKLYPDKKICVVFQPHLYTRTRDFAAEFGESLSNLDDVILLDIYPARELPIKKVTSELIYKQISGRHKTMCKKSELLEVLKTKEFDVLLTLGAGDIDKLVPEIQKFIEQKA
ncbi:MAG TPA: UDP-N-acetylmuramate--L-alanine ligase [Candidatus Enterocola sp.]|nr:UDP-N-acetylmuramate--L-alanine ligase [Candidatus Enterocola sp.]